jgi:hypothetical protein
MQKSNGESSQKYWKEIDEENAKRARRRLPLTVCQEGGPSGFTFEPGPAQTCSCGDD